MSEWIVTMVGSNSGLGHSFKLRAYKFEDAVLLAQELSRDLGRAEWQEYRIVGVRRCWAWRQMRAIRRLRDLWRQTKLFSAKREFDRAFAEADAKFRAKNKKSLNTKVIATSRVLCPNRLVGL